MATKEPKEKQFDLKAIELNLIANGQARAQQALFDMCTFIASERLAINVTQYTQFRVEDGKLFVTELDPPAEDKPEAETVSVA